MKEPIYSLPVICPDCGETVHLAEVRLAQLSAIPPINIGECPRCEIGSPLSEWRLGVIAVKPEGKR